MTLFNPLLMVGENIILYLGYRLLTKMIKKNVGTQNLVIFSHLKLSEVIITLTTQTNCPTNYQRMSVFEFYELLVYKVFRNKT